MNLWNKIQNVVKDLYHIRFAATIFTKTSHVLCGKPNKGHETITVFQNAIIIQEKFERGKKELFIFIKFIFYSEDKNTQTQKVEAKKKNLFQNINRKRSKIKTIHQILKFAFTKETAFC